MIAFHSGNFVFKFEPKTGPKNYVHISVNSIKAVDLNIFNEFNQNKRNSNKSTLLHSKSPRITLRKL